MAVTRSWTAPGARPQVIRVEKRSAVRLGWGWLVCASLLVAWGLAVARTFLVRRVFQPTMEAAPREASAQERAGLFTLFAVVVVFGVHSGVALAGLQSIPLLRLDSNHHQSGSPAEDLHRTANLEEQRQ